MAGMDAPPTSTLPLGAPTTSALNGAVEIPSPSGTRSAALAIGRALGLTVLCLAAGLVLLAVTYGLLLDEHGEDLPEAVAVLLLADLLVGTLAACAVGFLRRAGAWNLLLVPTVAISALALPAAAIALVRTGTLRQWPLDLLAAALVVASTVANLVLFAAALGTPVDATGSDLVIALVLVAIPLLWGRVRGTRRALVDSLRLEASAARREREAMRREQEIRIERAEALQRTAIARDLHDSLSHHLSLIAVHAGALEHRTDLPAEARREAAGIIRAEARSAGQELRAVLTTLRDADGSRTDPAGMIRLVQDARRAGQSVSCTWRDLDGEPQDLAPGHLAGAAASTVDVATSILRELLTNSRKHAPGQTLSVDLARDADQLVLTARNAVPHPGSPAPHGGLGLTGLAERAAGIGGSCRVLDDEVGTFSVQARLPWAP